MSLDAPWPHLMISGANAIGLRCRYCSQTTSTMPSRGEAVQVSADRFACPQWLPDLYCRESRCFSLHKRYGVIYADPP
jgi:hypothetical protein